MNNFPRIDVSVDAIVFGYKAEEDLSVLLIKRKNDPFKGRWALPGGFVEVDESLDDAVKRELKEETGIIVNEMEQLYTFGDPKRDPRKRVVSTAYLTLVPRDEHSAKAADDAAEATWFHIDKLPELAFDHEKILIMGIDRLRTIYKNKNAGYEKLFRQIPTEDLNKLSVLKGF